LVLRCHVLSLFRAYPPWGAIALLALCGCPTPAQTPDVPNTCAPPVADVQRADAPQGSGMTLDFAIRTLTIDDSDAAESAHTGFDLDHLCSGPTDADGCNHEDFFSPFAEFNYVPHRGLGCAVPGANCVGCVDNQLPTATNSLQAALGNYDVRADVRRRIVGGSIALVLRIADVDSLDNDTSVRVALYDAFPLEEDCDRLTASGARYAVHTRSLRIGGSDIDRDATQTFDGRIESGILITEASRSVLRLPWTGDSHGRAIDLALRESRLRMTLVEGGGRGDDGMIGGWMDGAEALRSTSRFVLDCAALPWVEAIVSGIVDVRMPCQDVCIDRTDPQSSRFGGISTAYVFTAMRATIAPNPRSQRPPGTCGSMPVTDGGTGCASPATVCDGEDGVFRCLDLSTDPNNCGACGARCCSGRCVAGRCASGCEGLGASCAACPARDMCDCVGTYGAIIDSSPTDCGACGRQCGLFSTCAAGRCNR